MTRCSRLSSSRTTCSRRHRRCCIVVRRRSKNFRHGHESLGGSTDRTRGDVRSRALGRGSVHAPRGLRSGDELPTSARRSTTLISALSGAQSGRCNFPSSDVVPAGSMSETRQTRLAASIVPSSLPHPRSRCHE